ncbi:hypothetical protein QAD02_005098 [Eretmocerus hayati]|uniref:Uncharacterized protein n=1 Tax=Eretmocerus hayati TaxID=131215 RepID=A0ACC2NRR9_9HYME|nr:hypothetical protein QAD02_005098 [Eretmocerus hayati]
MERKNPSGSKPREAPPNEPAAPAPEEVIEEACVDAVNPPLPPQPDAVLPPVERVHVIIDEPPREGPVQEEQQIQRGPIQPAAPKEQHYNMRTPRKLFIVSTILSYILGISSASQKPYKFKKEFSIPENVSKTFVKGSFFGTDSNDVSYAICEITKPNLEKLCNVTLISTSVENSDLKQTCNGVRVFASENKELFLGGYFQLWQFTKDHIVLAWWDNTPKDSTEARNQNFHITIQNMATCNSSHKKFTIDKVGYGSFPSLLLYKDSVHVVLNSLETCKAPGNCRIAFNLEGAQIGEVSPYKPSITGYASPVSSLDVSKGFFMEVQDTKGVQVFLVNQTGDGKTLIEDKFEAESDNHTVVFSSTHEHYGLCRATNLLNDSVTHKSVTCYQFNASGEKTLEKKLELPKAAAAISIHNLEKGGIIVMAAGRNMSNVNDADKESFDVYKVSSNGMSEKFITLDRPNIHCRKESNSDLDQPDIKISEFESRMCFYFACLTSSCKRMGFGARCVPKDDFQKRFD